MSNKNRVPFSAEENPGMENEQNTTSETTADSAVYTADFGSAEQRFSSAEPKRNKRYDDDDFWDLGETRRKVYQKPSFSDKPIENTLVLEATPPSPSVKREPIPPMPPKASSPAGYTCRRPADRTYIPSMEVNGREVRTSHYQASRPGTARQRTENARDLQNRQNEELRNMKAIREYDCSGFLIRHVEVKPWLANVQFYQRFAKEAEIFHDKSGSPAEEVSFFAYVPQYSKMNDKQQNFYLYVRDSIRGGQYISAELSYLLLYIFEIINLPHRISPEEGVRLLSDIWLNYRDRHPRLDVFLCEWMADYCLIHGVPLPRRLTPILPQIVQKAQFKEFYLDLLPDGNMENLADILIEFSSDYDYRRSRYYKGNEKAYEENIKAALANVLLAEQREKRGIFSFEKKYRVTRDAYCGAVVPAEIKRRIDVEFCSFTRSLETREIITNLVKYAENQLRLTLKIKAKLGVGNIDPKDQSILNGFFAPMIPQKKSERTLETEEYLKFYEAETTGFDFGAAEQIEQLSWDNTSKLTAADETEFNEISDTPNIIPEALPEVIEEPVVLPAKEEEDGAYNSEKQCLCAALEGSFRKYCKENGFFADDMASRINEIFLDRIGDIVLTEENGDYRLIEDYREDVAEWLN